MTKHGALRILKKYKDSTQISRVYDNRDGLVSDALLTLIPGFEYPDWSYKTIGDVRAYAAEFMKMDLFKGGK